MRRNKNILDERRRRLE